MAAGESQRCNWAASGCARRSLFVRFLYAFREAQKMDWKLAREAAVGKAVRGVTMELVTRPTRSRFTRRR